MAGAGREAPPPYRRPRYWAWCEQLFHACALHVNCVLLDAPRVMPCGAVEVWVGIAGIVPVISYRAVCPQPT